MAAKDYINRKLFHASDINRDLFHASDSSKEEFMKAPAIHVGTYEQAERVAELTTGVTREQIKDIQEGVIRPEEVYEHKIHSTPLSEHAKVYPVTLTDQQANRVHSEFLRQRNIKTPSSVVSSTLGSFGSRSRNSEESDLVEDRALAAMNRNEVIRYVNSRETRWDEYDGYGDSDPHSYLVPSPVINMSQMSQRTLPMDYSGIVESETTKRTRTRPESSQYDALATPKIEGLDYLSQ
jgi:hypothetical protein